MKSSNDAASGAMERAGNVGPIWLDTDEPAAFELHNGEGNNDLILIADHASNRVPRCLHGLGLDQITLASHIAWDAGTAVVARHLSRLLDAPLVQSNYSRLVIDCNRDPVSKQAIPETSDGIDIPGNRNLSAEHIAVRRKTFFDPYHLAISRALDDRKSKVMLSVHSFSPVLAGRNRPWSIGVCYGNDPRLAHLILPELARFEAGPIGDNEPYFIEYDIDYSLPYHATSRGLPHVMLEIRRDKIEHEENALLMAEMLSKTWLSIAAQLPPVLVNS